MSSQKFAITLFAVTALGMGLMSIGPAQAQRADAQASTADLKHAYEAAVAGAKGSDALDPAYELLGIAGTAKTRGIPDIANGATTAFNDLIQRATATATRKGGSSAQDALDQMVDLRFFARTTEIDPAMAALDTALRTLFPLAAATTQKHIDSSPEWDDKLSALSDLASLQASAVQVMLDDVAAAIGSGFDVKAAVLDKRASEETDDAERARKVGDLAELKRSRTLQITDAAANNVNAVAAQLQSGGKGTGGDMVRSQAGADIPSDLASGEGSCIETGYRVTSGKAVPGQIVEPADLKLHRTHDRDCVNSGRLPSTARCTTANLSFACYGKVTNGEKITYVYRGTREESFFRKSCAADDQIAATKVPTTGAPFRGSDVALAFICAPSGGEISGD